MRPLSPAGFGLGLACATGAAGAVVSLLKGYGAGYKGLIPPYIVLTQPQGRFSEEGFLGPRLKPFATGGDPNGARHGLTDPGPNVGQYTSLVLDSLGLPRIAYYDVDNGVNLAICDIGTPGCETPELQ